MFDALVRLGELRGRRVLEVGCGTGRLAQALEERELARVWAVDASDRRWSRGAKALGVNARVARAEALPFKAGWFDAVVMRMALHLRRPAPGARPGATRHRRPAARVVIATEDPASFDHVWFTRFFPSVPAIDGARSRMSPASDRARRCRASRSIGSSALRQRRTISREHALDLIRSKGVSTFDLLAPAEYADGLARAEAELPERLDYRFDWLLAVAGR